MNTTTTTSSTTTPYNDAHLSFSQRFGESLLSDRRRRLREVAQADELVMKSHGDRMFRETEHRVLKTRGLDPTTVPTVAQSFSSATGAEFKAMMLRA